MKLSEAIDVIAALHQQLAEQQRIIETYERQIAQLKSRIEELERKRNKTSKNSGKPPSSDSPYQSADSDKKDNRTRNRRKRKRRQGKARELLPLEDVHKVIEVVPRTCAHCQHELAEKPGNFPVHRHQVWELPDAKAKVSEFQMYACQCDHCGRVTRAELPTSVSASPFGPRLQSMIAMLCGQYRLSKRQVQELLETLWGVKISRGGIGRCEQRISEAIRNAVDEAHTYVQNAPVAYADETPWKERHKLKWLWSAGAGLVWIYRILDRRTTDSAKKLLSENFAGKLVSDDYGGYRFVPLENRQSCWSHIGRRFVAMSEFKRDPIAIDVGTTGLRLISEMMGLYRLLQAEKIDRRCFRRRMSKIEKTMLYTLKKGIRSESSWTRSKCQNIYELGPSLWLFVRHPEVEPTNNRSERAIRPAVIYRKLSLGTQSPRGSRFVERMLTATQTLKLQCRGLLSFLEQSLTAPLLGRIQPSLLPA